MPNVTHLKKPKHRYDFDVSNKTFVLDATADYSTLTFNSQNVNDFVAVFANHTTVNVNNAMQVAFAPQNGEAISGTVVGNDNSVYVNPHSVVTIKQGFNDVVDFAADVTALDQVWFRKVGNDLVISRWGSLVTSKPTAVVWEDYFSLAVKGDAPPVVVSLPTKNGVQDYAIPGGFSGDAQLMKLIDVMSRFDPFSTANPELPANVKKAVDPVVAATWIKAKIA
jgi:hypothetical protein